MNKTRILFFITAILVVGSFFIIHPVHADLVGNIKTTGENTITGIFGALPANASPTVLVGTIVKAMMGLLSVLFVVLIFSAGLIWMTAAGNDEKLQKAIGIAMFAVIGLVIAISGYVLAYFVFDIILEANQLGTIF